MVVLVATMVAMPARAAETITVSLDQATITKLPERVATIVIGNPLVADVTLQPGGLLVVTGKGYGNTNLIALDRSGAVLTEREIAVVGSQEKIVVVYRGMERESYSCTPQCQRRLTLGDSGPYFDEIITQDTNRTTRAQAQGNPATH
jgi:hypothetical protein